MDKEKKQKIIKKFAKHKDDTGSAEVQIAVLTNRIESLTEHLKQHKNDRHSRRGLLQMIGDRRRLLDYLDKNNSKSYKELIKELNLRK